MKTKIPLDQISVASPCTVPWGALAGNDHARFCGECQQHVYNLSDMTREDAENLITEHEGRLCVRFYKRLDGTIMTQDCPMGWRALKRRMAFLAAVAAAIIFAMFSLMTLGVFAATRDDQGARVGNPVQRVWDWLLPPPVCVMGKPIPMPPAPGGGPPAPPPN